MAEKPVKVEIVGDSSKYKKALDEAHDATGKFGKVTGEAGKALAGAFVAGGVVAGIHGIVTAASDYNETVSKTKVVLGSAADGAIEFADTAAESFGLSKQAALDAESTFAVFGKSAGLSGDALGGFSQKLTGLAADMASFSNTSPEQAIEAIGAALRGESEPIRAYGVLLDDATLRQQALSMGIYDGTGSLTAQQKVLAAQASIFKQTGDAQGDFARTSGGLAGQSKILSAEIENLKVSMGSHLIPVAIKVISTILDVGNAFSDMAGGIDINTGAIKRFFQEADKHQSIKELGDALHEAAKAADESHGFFTRLADSLDSRWDGINETFKKMGKESPEALKAIYLQLVELKAASDAGDPAAKKLAEDYEITAGHLDHLYDAYIKIPPQIAETERETHKLSGTMSEMLVASDASTGSFEHMGVAAADARTHVLDAAKALAQAEDDARATQRATDNLKASWDQLKGSLDDQQAWLNIETSFDDVKQKGIDAFDAAKHHSADAEQKARDYDSALLGLRGQVIDYARDVGGLPLDVTTMIQAQVDNGSIANAKQLLDAIAQARTVIYNAQVSQHREYASGTSSAAPGVALVGEHGPELVTMGGGERVFTAGQTAGMLGGGVVNVTINMPPGSNGDDVVRAIKKFEARNGPGWRS